MHAFITRAHSVVVLIQRRWCWDISKRNATSTFCNTRVAYLLDGKSNVSDNTLMGTLKPQSNGPLCSNMVISKLAVYGWIVTSGTARKGLDGAAARPGPSPSLYQM